MAGVCCGVGGVTTGCCWGSGAGLAGMEFAGACVGAGIDPGAVEGDCVWETAVEAYTAKAARERRVLVRKRTSDRGVTSTPYSVNRWL